MTDYALIGYISHIASDQQVATFLQRINAYSAGRDRRGRRFNLTTVKLSSEMRLKLAAIARVNTGNAYPMRVTPLSKTAAPRSFAALDVPVAYAILYDRRDPFRVLLRQGTSRRWGLPGGKLYFREHPLSGVRREIEEEVGLRIKARNLSYLGCFRLPGFTTCWSAAKARSHGYSRLGAEALKQSDTLHTKHSRQYIFCAEISAADAPRCYDGRRYLLADRRHIDKRIVIRPRFYSLIRWWQLLAEEIIPKE